ncbi:hypothetical protein HPB50_025917 [Hyalomma asiaticum]|uniref:Uncharacterized protein n=1 Tax=Hyalomma asiaticum TaxID=266040 RepID=A0ACB7RPK4_HYAAI|nr:hypothetical protein HPB50_025917 [Hyalomma asiaticum]
MQALFGIVSPSWGHIRRMIKILKAEYWRQVRLFYDYLRIVLAEETQQPSTDRRFREFKKPAAQSTEFLWKRARAGLPPRPKQERTAANNVTIIGCAYEAAAISSNVNEYLRKGVDVTSWY